MTRRAAALALLVASARAAAEPDDAPRNRALAWFQRDSATDRRPPATDSPGSRRRDGLTRVAATCRRPSARCRIRETDEHRRTAVRRRPRGRETRNAGGKNATRASSARASGASAAARGLRSGEAASRSRPSSKTPTRRRRAARELAFETHWCAAWCRRRGGSRRRRGCDVDIPRSRIVSIAATPRDRAKGSRRHRGIAREGRGGTAGAQRGAPPPSGVAATPRLRRGHSEEQDRPSSIAARGRGGAAGRAARSAHLRNSSDNTTASQASWPRKRNWTQHASSRWTASLTNERCTGVRQSRDVIVYLGQKTHSSYDATHRNTLNASMTSLREHMRKVGRPRGTSRPVLQEDDASSPTRRK